MPDFMRIGGVTAAPQGLDRQPHGSLMTQRWRETDSNFRSLEGSHLGDRRRAQQV
jgi:hypothetical protein